jgi:ABC-type lipoprotein export system ATPase subunit
MMLSATGLRKSYGAKEAAVDAVVNADLVVKDEEFISIVGRSGSGKSTLLAMIGGLTRPSAGEIVIGDEEIWTLSEQALADLRRRRIGFVFQFSSLLSNLRAIDNVALPALFGKELAPERAYSRAHDLLARVGLSHRVAAYPGQMSGGEQRRVAIARALVNRPLLLLADEPTSDLDAETEQEIVSLLEALRREEQFGMVVVTHNRELASLADRAYEMRRGVLVSIDAPPDAERAARVRRAALPEPTKPEPSAVAAAEGARAFDRLGANFWATFGRAAAGAALVFLLVMITNAGVERYQRKQVKARQERLTALEELATSTLRSDVDSITSLGDNRYEVTIYLENTRSDPPIYVLSPSVQAFVQVGTDWREAPLAPIADASASVLKVTGRQLYRFTLEARFEKFAQLLPHYMHVRFTNNMLVSPASTPTDELFQRNDNYFVYLKPDNVDDATILKDVRFPGPPPLWIWMPPH